MRTFLTIVLGLLVIAGLELAASFYLAPNDQLEKSDVIVAVSGGDTLARANAAVRLYQEGWAPLLVFSGAAKDPGSPSNAEAMRQIALSQNVPPDVITLEKDSKNTTQNANNVAGVLDALHAKRIILVTSPYHQRRAYTEFRSRLSSEIEIINHPALDKAWSKRLWWLTPRGWYLTLTEVPKTLFAQFIE